MHRVATAHVDWKAIREDFPILREQAHRPTFDLLR
jgi:hypothetical protein